MGAERIKSLVQGYFDFAEANRNLWAAIYEHRAPGDIEMRDRLVNERVGLTGIISREVEAVLPMEARGDAVRLARSLIATVHGHCSFALGGSFALMGESDPLAWPKPASPRRCVLTERFSSALQTVGVR